MFLPVQHRTTLPTIVFGPSWLIYPIGRGERSGSLVFRLPFFIWNVSSEEDVAESADRDILALVHRDNDLEIL